MTRVQTFFSTFVKQQIQYIQRRRPDIRYCGVLEPVAKFPRFADRLVGLSKVLNIQATSAQTSIIRNALEQIGHALLVWVKRVSKSKPKYSDIVMLENARFMVKSFEARRLLPDLVEEARGCMEKAMWEYQEWLCEECFYDLHVFVITVRE